MENMGEKLINRLQRNERAAYMELYDFYFKRLHHFAVNFVFDYDVANDIVQSVLSNCTNPYPVSAQMSISGLTFV